MAPKSVQQRRRAAKALVDRQHGVIARHQLLALGFTSDAIRHRVAIGRLFPIYPGVYAYGRSQLSQHGRLMAAVLFCGPGAALTHLSAAVLWGIGPSHVTIIDVAVPERANPRTKGIKVRRRRKFQTTTRHGIPVTTPIQTLIDCAAVLPRKRVVAMINEADAQDVIRADELARRLPAYAGQRGAPLLREILEPATFVVTHSELERLFVPLARKAGLPKPITQRVYGTDRVDFAWPDLELVVEADSLRYHRTPLQQTKDTERDHRHAMAERVPLRFTHFQIACRPDYVVKILTGVAKRLRRAASRTAGLPRAA